MSKTLLGNLYKGNLFMFKNKVYRAGKPIDGTDGYVACVDIHTHKITRFNIDTIIEDMKGDTK